MHVRKRCQLFASGKRVSLAEREPGLSKVFCRVRNTFRGWREAIYLSSVHYQHNSGSSAILGRKYQNKRYYRLRAFGGITDCVTWRLLMVNLPKRMNKSSTDLTHLGWCIILWFFKCYSIHFLLIPLTKRICNWGRLKCNIVSTPRSWVDTRSEIYQRVSWDRIGTFIQINVGCQLRKIWIWFGVFR